MADTGTHACTASSDFPGSYLPTKVDKRILKVTLLLQSELQKKEKDTRRGTIDTTLP